MLRKGTRGELNLCHACFRGRASQLCHYTPCGEANARMAGNRRKGALVCQHKRRHCARRHWLRGARTLLRGRVALSPVPWLSPVADSSSRIAWNVYLLVLQRRWPSTVSKKFGTGVVLSRWIKPFHHRYNAVVTVSESSFSVSDKATPRYGSGMAKGESKISFSYRRKENKGRRQLPLLSL